MKTILYSIFGMLILISCTSSSEGDYSENSVIGAWELAQVEWNTSDSSGVWKPYKSIRLFTEKHYSIEEVDEFRPSFKELAEGEEQSAEEIADAYRALYSNSGSYEIRGDSIYYSVHVSKHPNFMNDNPDWSTQLTVGKDTLTSKYTGEETTAVYTYVRID